MYFTTLAILLSVYMFPQQDTNTTNFNSMCKEYITSLHELQCHTTQVTNRKNELWDKGETYTAHGRNCYVRVTQIHFMNGMATPGQPFMVFVKKNNTNHYVGHIVPKYGDKVPKSMSPHVVLNFNQWVIQNEAHRRNGETDPIEMHIMKTTQSPAMAGFMMFAGINANIGDYDSKLLVLDSTTTQNDVVTFKYHGASDTNFQTLKGESKASKFGKYILLVESDSTMSMKGRDWTLNRTNINMEYTQCGTVTVPLKKTEASYFTGNDGQDFVVQTVTDYTFSSLDSHKPFEMATYGLPERQPKLVIEDTPDAPASIPVDSSSIENIPVWAWLAGAGMAFMVTGLLVLAFKRKDNATA